MMEYLMSLSDGNEEQLTEEQFIGELIVARNNVDVALAAVREEMIQCARCSAALRLIAGGIDRDPGILYRELKKDPAFRNGERVGEWLARLIELAFNGTGAYMLTRARQVVDQYKQRLTVELGRRMMSEQDVTKALADCEKSIETIRAVGDPDKQFNMAEVMADLVDQLDAGISIDSLPGTGISQVDGCLRGFEKGSNTVVGALTSVGKSAFVQRAAINIAKRGMRVILFSCEMTVRQVAERFLVMESGLSHGVLADRERWDDAKRKKIVEAQNAIGNWPIEIVYCSGWSIDDIEAKAFSGDPKKPPALIIVDYLQLVNTTEGSNSEEKLSLVAKRVMEMGGKLGCATISVAQLNDMAEGAEVPTLQSIRGSRAVAHHAHNVIFLSRNKMDQYAPVRVTIAKNRNGPLGSFEVPYNASTYEFEPEDVTDRFRGGNVLEVEPARHGINERQEVIAGVL